MLSKTIQATIRFEEKYFIAECAGYPIVTQGMTQDETIANLREAIDLYLEGEDLHALGFESNPVLVCEMDKQP